MKTTLTIEQSARLIELGVDKELANDSSFVFDKQGSTIPCTKGYALKPNEYCAEIQFADEDNPCVMAHIFNLQDLLSILPKKIKCGSTSFRLRIGVDVYDNYWVKYVTTPWGVDPLKSSQKAEELCDAIYAEICWLKEDPELVWL